jgi:hypothetical protein
MSQLPYAGADNKNSARPLLYYENAWVRVLGGTADFKVGNWPLGAASSMALDARLKYDDAGYKPDDSPALTGMDERKGGGQQQGPEARPAAGPALRLRQLCADAARAGAVVRQEVR